MSYTPEYIKNRLKANGNPSIFEEKTLQYIESLEEKISSLNTKVEELEEDIHQRIHNGN